MKSFTLRTLVLSAVSAVASGCVSHPAVQRSDVQVVRTVGWWSYQQGLTVESLAVRASDERLRLSNNKSLVEYEISGKMVGPRGWKPKISSLFISQRYDPADADQNERIGDFELVPVVGVTKNRKYESEPVPFRIVVQELVESVGWGSHQYEVRCAGIVRRFELRQRK